MKLAFIHLLSVLVVLTWQGAGGQPFDSETAFAEFPPVKGRMQMVILRHIDADTIEAGFITPVKLRIWGVDAPEINTPEGKRALKEIEVLVPKNEIMPVHLKGREKFGRTLADIQTREGFWLSKVMVDNKLAKPWSK